MSEGLFACVLHKWSSITPDCHRVSRLCVTQI